MKVKVNFTVEVDAKVVQEYLNETYSDDTVPVFVREYFLDAVEGFDSFLHRNLGVEHETVLNCFG